MPEFSAHITRHTFATRLHEDFNIPLLHVSQWLGHRLSLGDNDKASRTTLIYIHADNWKNIKEDVEILKDMKIA